MTWTVWSKFNWTVYFLRAVFRFRFIACTFKYKALVGVLSSSIWVLYQDRIFLAAMELKPLPTCFVLSARTTKFTFFFSFSSWRMETLQRARNVWRLSSQFKYHKTALSFIIHFLYWTFLYLILNHNYNKILKSDWLSTALISALIGQFDRTVRVMLK